LCAEKHCTAFNHTSTNHKLTKKLRLQTLEIKGFKSFADKTIINFKDDVIGIVGPNGCGKSNVVDAIRWVLGEQKSKELRSDKMESVIFNGTKSRKQAGVAEVSLTFENTKNLLPTEYNMVTITRVLFRTGESEYRLNGVSCRLKDISTLLMDTGIGSNSYAIIALGMVDDLLADREQSRRRLFEQASGISKYKARKQETLTKLKGTEEDLNRVEDLLFEIDGQLKTLERQAKRAQKWVEMKAEYRTLSLELAVFKLANFKDKFRTLKDLIQRSEEKLAGLDASLSASEASLAAEKQQNLDKEKLLSDRQRELNSLVGRIRGGENDKKLLQQKQEFLTNSLRDLQKQIDNATRQQTQLTDDIEYYRGELNSEKRLELLAEDELVAAEQALKKIREQHANLKTELDAQLRQQQQVERSINELEKQRIAQQTSVDSLQRDILDATQKQQTRSAELESIKTERDVLHKKVVQQQRFLEDLEEKEENRKADLAEQERVLILRQAELNTANRSLDSKRNEYKLTKSMVESMEGFPESIRFLSKDKEWAKRVPLLSDVLYCQPEYRVAVENFLEPYLNYYIAPSVADAAEAIQRLSKNQRGRANFFILSENKKAGVNYTNTNTDWTQALSIVECDKAYLPVFEQILQNVFIVTQDKKAQYFEQNINENLPETVVLLSSDGAFTKGEHTLSGGSVGLFEGKRIGRKKNLEVLEQEISVLEKSTKTLADTVKTLQTTIESLKKQNQEPILRRERDELNRLQQQVVALSGKFDSAQAFIEDISTRKKNAEDRISALSNADGDVAQKLADLQQQQQAAIANIGSTDSNFTQLAEQLSAASAKNNEKNIAFIKQQSKVQTLQRELSFREKQRTELAETADRNARTLAQNTTELSNVSTQIDALTQDLQAKYTERQVFEKTLTNAEQGYYQSRKDITELEEKTRLQNKERQTQQQQIALQKEQFTEVKLEMTSISERLRIEFSVEVNDIINQEPNANHNQKDLTERTDSLKKRLDNYGEVNPMAIEAYTEMEVRQKFIVEQRDDLLAAKNSLLETITEIETTATNRFMESFLQVREHFIRVFRSLFTEDDSCDLILVDPETPLESRIDIIAKPKGKRPQSINQLSGGEKTLTATALLFSLYLLKPAPFCIFDEVDAPLDDANIDKFNKIIKEFSKNSQFIIVTHNKATMSSVDVIYGVSMVEQGVSRVLPVDFRSLT
jgi:chromosome segregation protein